MKKIVITFEQNGNSSIEAFGSRKMKSGGDDDVSQKTRVNQ
jgi:hypothetical protein